jgi:hypothetical protein
MTTAFTARTLAETRARHRTRSVGASHTTVAIGALALLFAAAACRREAVRQVACPWPEPLDTAGWAVADAGPFVLKVPPGLSEQAPAGTVDYLGLWAGRGRALAFHYGPSAADPRERGTGGEEVWRCSTVLGGDSAVIRVGTRSVQARPGEWQRHAVAEAWWPRAGADSTRLLVVGWGPEADSAAIAREALSAARTVRFRRVWTPADSVRQLHRFCTGLRRQAEARPEYRSAWEEWQQRCPQGDPPPPVEYDQVR